MRDSGAHNSGIIEHARIDVDIQAVRQARARRPRPMRPRALVAADAHLARRPAVIAQPGSSSQ